MTAAVHRKIHSKISEAYLQFFPKLLKFSEIGRENEGWKSPVFCFNWSVIPGPACDSWTISQRTSSNFCTVTTLDWEMAELDVLFCRNQLPAAPQICLHFCQEKIFNLKIEKQGILIFYATTVKYKNHIYSILDLWETNAGWGRGGFIDRDSLYHVCFRLRKWAKEESEKFRVEDDGQDIDNFVTQLLRSTMDCVTKFWFHLKSIFKSNFLFDHFPMTTEWLCVFCVAGC